MAEPDKQVVQNYIRDHVGTSSAQDMAKARGRESDLGAHTTFLLEGSAASSNHSSGGVVEASQRALESLAQKAIEYGCVFVADLRTTTFSRQDCIIYHGTGYKIS